jgi:hypothetical protein
MSTQRFALATVAGGVTLFILGYLIYGLALADFYAANAGSATGVMREEPLFWAVGFGELALAALLTLVLGRWAGISGMGDGLKGGAIVGLLLALAINLIIYGVMNTMNLTAALADVVVAAFRLGLAGAVIGAVISKGGAVAPEL